MVNSDFLVKFYVLLVTENRKDKGELDEERRRHCQSARALGGDAGRPALQSRHCEGVAIGLEAKRRWPHCAEFLARWEAGKGLPQVTINGWLPGVLAARGRLVRRK